MSNGHANHFAHDPDADPIPAKSTVRQRDIRKACAVFDGMTMDAAETHFLAAIIHMALVRTRGNQVKAAELLNVHRNTLSRNMQAVGIAARDYMGGTRQWHKLQK